MKQKKKKETKDAEGFIEIPFGAFDSETMGWTYTIPEGFTAKIEDGKIIVEKKESEDERIRKEIMDFIYWAIDRGSITNEQRERSDSWLAYLEKQKEQKPVEYPEKGNGYWFGFNEGKGSVLDHPEEYGLIKPAGWSEEDETALSDLMWCIEQARKSAKNENDMGNIWFAENWVKKRIKSLRPQPHWKPSEEQINALAKAIIILGEQGNNKTVMYLNEIRTELKKL